MAKKTTQIKAPVTQEMIDACLAYAVAEGDIVNFRFLFVPYSPLRTDSPEDIASEKYAYLRPDGESNPRFEQALREVRKEPVRNAALKQLEKQGPAQLPSELILRLADNAVSLGKYTAAAQAYELLRIRRRMQEEFFAQADAALDAQDVAKAVRGYAVATGLAYDYAAFPEPQPAVPNFHTKALVLHAEYPRKIEDCLALQSDDALLRTALAYLLLSPEAAARICARPVEVQRAFATELVRVRDPEWDVFVRQYHEACEAMRELGERLERKAQRRQEGTATLADEVADLQEALQPEQIPNLLLGRVMAKGEWWQYMKELAYRHPPAVLFVSRQAVSKDLEIIVPRFRSDSVWVRELGLA